MHICRLCTKIIIVKIHDNDRYAKLHSIIIYKYEMNLKIYALIFKLQEHFQKTSYLLK